MAERSAKASCIQGALASVNKISSYQTDGDGTESKLIQAFAYDTAGVATANIIYNTGTD